MSRCLALALGAALPLVAAAAEPRALNAKDEALLRKLEARVDAVDAGFDGALGVAIVDLGSGRTILRHPDEVFPAASIIKLPLLVELFRQDQRGGARLVDPYVVDAKDLVADSAMLAGMTPGVTRLTNRDLATFMIGVSDNGATNVLIDRVGMQAVNGLLDSLGLRETRLRRKMMDVAAARAGRENTATPRELAALLGKLHAGEILDAARTEACLAALATPKESFLGLPEGTRYASKTGSLEGVRGEAGIVHATGRPFVIVVLAALAVDGEHAQGVIGQIGRAAFETFDRLGRATPQGRVLYPRQGT
jgi:beta-lactamase class A